MSILFQPTRLVGAIAIAMGYSPAIFAEDTIISAQLDPIVVTASKVLKKRVKFPLELRLLNLRFLNSHPSHLYHNYYRQMLLSIWYKAEVMANLQRFI